MPLMPGMPGMNNFGGPNMGAIGMGGPAMMGQSKMPMMGNMGAMGSMPPSMGGAMMGMNTGMPQMGTIGGDVDPKKKLEQMIRDKEKFLKMEANTSKRLIMPSLKFMIERAGVNPADSGPAAEKILKEDLQDVFRYLENDEELKRKIGK